jgi:2'-5' RNA ligase
MKDLSNAIPGYGVYEYLLVLNPHEELRNRIIATKTDFFNSYQAETAKWGKPHLTLVNFVQYQMLEERIINRLKIIAMGYHPLKIELKDFGSFPAHTIYINVTSKMPIQNLVKQIRTNAQKLIKLNNDNKPHFMLEPHITIARKLLPWQYEKGWLEYSHKHFTAKFIADAMLLLKRPVGQLKYEIVQRFNFENLPVATTQGELFG